jgi:hypothetical protein
MPQQPGPSLQINRLAQVTGMLPEAPGGRVRIAPQHEKWG